MRPASKRCLSASLPIAAMLFVGEVGAQEADQSSSANAALEPLETRSVRDGEALGVDQIVLPQASSGDGDFQIAAAPAAQNGQAQVGQLPPDLEVPDDDGTSPESAISQPIQSPEAALISKVAEAWQVIRGRGQQPTPELIAREIGPDQLATFLDQNPEATDIFGKDSDTLPVDVPGLEGLPDSGVLFIPPEGG